jgi:hypothetical protein
VEVDIELDTAPREVTVPVDLAKALEKDPKGRETFKTPSFSNKQWHVLA